MKIIRKNKSDENDDTSNFTFQIAIIASCSVVALVAIIMIYLTAKETCFVPLIKEWIIIEKNKKQRENVEKKKKHNKIDKKKIAPKPFFKIKPPAETGGILNKQIQNFFELKSHSEGNFFKEKKSSQTNFVVKSTIMRITSKNRLLAQRKNRPL